MKLFKKIKNHKIDVFWIMVVLIMTAPFVYVEAGLVTSAMVLIIYAMQLFQMWALNDIQDSLKTLFDNDIVITKVFNRLSDEVSYKE